MPEVVLDSSSVNGLLRMAADEGLLFDRDDEGDKLLYGLQQRSLPEWHKQQILEQVFLNSKIHSLRSIPFEWLHGDFLENNPIHIAETKPEAIDEGRQVSLELIKGMLRAKGYDRNFEEWIPIFEKSQAVLTELMAFEARNPGTRINPLSAFVRGCIDIKYRDSEEYRIAQEWNAAYNQVSPLMSAFAELLELSEYAVANTGHLKTPVYRLSPNLFNLATDLKTDDNVVRVYRMTTQNLGVMPICTSLRHALELAADPATLSLRHQIDEWVKSLGRDSADLTTRIQKDIDKATASLANSRSLKIAGSILGYISIPASVAGFVMPLLGAAGLALSCVAVMCEREGRRIENRVRWVGFGCSRVNG